MTSKVHNFAHKASFQPLPQKPVGTFLITRKDTIIIAMLVNIALLVVLFATATKKYDPALVEKKEVITAIQEPQRLYEEKIHAIVKPEPLDEIDAILERFTTVKPELSQKVTACEAPKKQEILALQSVKKEKTADSRKRQQEQVAEYYVVKSGDNPWTIARKFHINFADLLKLNDLDEDKAKNLKIGQKIRIR